jgi:hypothetical protein
MSSSDPDIDACQAVLGCIAALANKDAASLTPSDSLSNDFGFSDNKFVMLTLWLKQEAVRLTGNRVTFLKSQVAAADTVANIVEVFFEIALDKTLSSAAIAALIKKSQGEMR